MIHGRSTGDGRVYRAVEDVPLVEIDIPRSEPFQLVTDSPFLVYQFHDHSLKFS